MTHDHHVEEVCPSTVTFIKFSYTLNLTSLPLHSHDGQVTTHTLLCLSLKTTRRKTKKGKRWSVFPSSGLQGAAVGIATLPRRRRTKWNRVRVRLRRRGRRRRRKKGRRVRRRMRRRVRRKKKRRRGTRRRRPERRRPDLKRDWNRSQCSSQGSAGPSS